MILYEGWGAICYSEKSTRLGVMKPEFSSRSYQYIINITLFMPCYVLQIFEALFSHLKLGIIIIPSWHAMSEKCKHINYNTVWEFKHLKMSTSALQNMSYYKYIPSNEWFSHTSIWTWIVRTENQVKSWSFAHKHIHSHFSDEVIHSQCSK